MVTGVYVPRWGITMERGEIVTWLAEEGERVQKGQPLLEIQTEKVTNVVEALADGILRMILFPVGTTPAVGELIAVIAEPTEQFDLAALRDADISTTRDSPAPDQLKEAKPVERAERGRVRAAPAARKLAQEHGVDLATIPGTGPEGSISREDVERAIKQATAVTPNDGSASPAVRMVARLTPVVARMVAENNISDAELATIKGTGEGGRLSKSDIENLLKLRSQPSFVSSPLPLGDASNEIIPLSSMRRAIAEHMVRSKRVAPHVTSVHEANMSRVLAYQAAQQVEFAKQGVKLTLTAFFVQAVVAALKEFPMVKATYTEQGIFVNRNINIGIAVAIEDGLIVPIIKDADAKNLLGIARTVNDLSTRAREKRLEPDEVQGGTFTITNYGIFGSLFGTPIINQPQSAILGVGAIQKRVVVIGDAIAVRPMTYLGITFDHRLLDGSISDRFMQTVREFLEEYAG